MPSPFSFAELLRQKQDELTAHTAFFPEYQEILDSFTAAGVPLQYLFWGSVPGLAVSGTAADLTTCFRICRAAGWTTTDKPAANNPQAFIDWRKGNARFSLHFTSTKCQYKQVGTETKEVPIYEIVCE